LASTAFTDTLACKTLSWNAPVLVPRPIVSHMNTPGNQQSGLYRPTPENLSTANLCLRPSTAGVV
jgi:hypothetical protein